MRSILRTLAFLAVAPALSATPTPTPTGTPTPSPSATPAASPTKKDVAADINEPRADARRIAFDVSQGTWISVDVSPDGSTIVFDLLGDIYSLPIAGGAAKALTRGPAYDSQPRFSPDGKTIAFTTDRSGIENVWLMDFDGGNPRPLTEEKDFYVRTAAWTPDGNYLIARKEEGKRAGIPPVELWMYNRYGGGGVKLTSSDDLSNAAGVVASRDGRDGDRRVGGKRNTAERRRWIGAEARCERRDRRRGEVAAPVQAGEVSPHPHVGGQLVELAADRQWGGGIWDQRETVGGGRRERVSVQRW